MLLCVCHHVGLVWCAELGLCDVGFFAVSIAVGILVLAVVLVVVRLREVLCGNVGVYVEVF